MEQRTPTPNGGAGVGGAGGLWLTTWWAGAGPEWPAPPPGVAGALARAWAARGRGREGQGSEAGGDLHAVFVEEELTDFGVVHAGGNARRVERPETVTGGDVHAQAHGFDAGDEGFVVLAVALPARFQSFFGDDGEAF